MIPGGGRLSGRVIDPAGGTVAGAQVQALDANGNVVAEVKAGGDGVYAFPSLPEGVFRLEVQAPGFNRSVINGVAIAGGRPNQQDAQLQIGSAAQTVEVNASAPTISAESASIAMVRGSRNTGSGGPWVVALDRSARLDGHQQTGENLHDTHDQHEIVPADGR